MNFLALFLAATAPVGSTVTGSSLVDVLMAEVTETCLLPDISKDDPRKSLKARGWKLEGTKFRKRLNDSMVVVEIHWPASKRAAAGCSFSTSSISSFEAYDFFRKRIGEPNDIPWGDKFVAGWKIKTNGHDAGVYVSRNDPRAETPGLLLHILQI